MCRHRTWRAVGRRTVVTAARHWDDLNWCHAFLLLSEETLFHPPDPIVSLRSSTTHVVISLWVPGTSLASFQHIYYRKKLQINKTQPDPTKTGRTSVQLRQRRRRWGICYHPYRTPTINTSINIKDSGTCAGWMLISSNHAIYMRNGFWK